MDPRVRQDQRHSRTGDTPHDLCTLSRERFRSREEDDAVRSCGRDAAHAGDADVRRGISAARADRGQREVTRDLMTRRVATRVRSGRGREPDKGGRALKHERCHSSRAEVKMILDGVGLMGHDDHTPGETADLTTLLSQAKRARDHALSADANAVTRGTRHPAPGTKAPGTKHPAPSTRGSVRAVRASPGNDRPALEGPRPAHVQLF